jgi:hypothetical protein
MMIEAVIYGATPRSTIEIFDNPPPEKNIEEPKKSILLKETLERQNIHSRKRDVGCEAVDHQ